MEKIAQNDPQAVSKAIDVLSSGRVIVYPTDTLYGFGVDATNDNAIHQLNKIKGRIGPISVIAPNSDTALSWINLPIEQLDLAPFYLGGAKTLIIPVKSGIVSKIILGADNSLGIRIPNNEFCNKLSEIFYKPITTTSVNRTNQEPLNDPELIEQYFKNDIDLLIDAGTLSPSKGSTIYKLDRNNNVQILRK